MPLLVNGLTIGVRLNCWYALWQLRKATMRFPLWIDSIAVNQDDSFEKSIQVALMGDIYSQAKSVAACIGGGKSLQACLVDEASDIDIDLAFQELDKLQYWYRAWVRQEVVRAQHIDVFCGCAATTWADLTAICRRVHGQTGKYSDRKPGKNSVILELMEQRRLYRIDDQGQGSLTSSGLIRQFGNLHCSNPRDKLYALISLIPKGDPLFKTIKPDYDKSTFGIFLELQTLLTSPDFFWIDPNPIELLTKLVVWLKMDQADEGVKQFLQSCPRLPLRSNYLGRPSVPIRFTGAATLAPRLDLRALCAVAVAKEDMLPPPVQHLSMLTPAFNTLYDAEWGHLPKLNLVSNSRHQYFAASPRGRMLLYDGTLQWMQHEGVFLPRLWFARVLLVNADVQENDMIVRIHWCEEATPHIRSVNMDGLADNSVSFAIIRVMPAACLEGETKLCDTYSLHSWGTVVGRDYPYECDKDAITELDTRGSSEWQLQANLKTARLLMDGDRRAPEEGSTTIDLSSKQITRLLTLNMDPLSALGEASQHREGAQFDPVSCSKLGTFFEATAARHQEADARLQHAILEIERNEKWRLNKLFRKHPRTLAQPNIHGRQNRWTPLSIIR